MESYVAFLRGINVGGHKVLPMAELARTFDRAGATGPSTYRASGNVRFRLAPGSLSKSVARIERQLRARFGGEVRLFVRSVADLRAIARAAPFAAVRDASATPYVTFLERPLPPSRALPETSPTGHVEIVGRRPLEIFSLGRAVGGRPGFPNSYLESIVQQLATTRNWSTVTGVLDANVRDATA